MDIYIPLVGALVILGMLWFIIRLLLAIQGTITWGFSGETGSLLVHGFTSRGRRFRQTVGLQTIVTHAATATRLNLPLAPALRAAALGSAGRARDALDQMADLLDAGYPFYRAFEAGVPGCPPTLVSFLRESEYTGQTAQALSNLEQMLNERLGEETHTRRHTSAYVLFMLCSSLLVLSGILILVIPKFSEIFQDFDAQVPQVTVHLIEFSRQGMPVIFLLIVAIVVLLLVMCLFSLLARRSSGDRPNTFASFIGALRWALPATRHMDYGLGMASAIRLLANNLRAGVPLDRAARLTPAISPANRLRLRLEDFTRYIQAGELPHRAAREAGLGKVLVSVLRMIERGEPAEESLSHAADYYRAIAFRWWHTLSALSVPVATLTMAVLVGFIVYALFLPLIYLINSVGDTLV
jgi:type II secretory pathway component PulF